MVEVNSLLSQLLKLNKEQLEEAMFNIRVELMERELVSNE
tara:strand:- start:2624 stop:2743 length:120 start_codon:yes stop_codon:yes gene_type:complete